MAYNCFMAQNGTGLNFISDGVGSCMQYYFGDPILIGVIFLLFFVAFLFLQGTRNDFKLVMIVPITLLAIMWVPWLYVFLLMIGTYIMYRVIMYKVSG